MDLLIRAIYGAMSQGVLLGIMALGVFITYKVLDYADLTVDGSFVTGAAVVAVLIVNGVNPFVATLVSVLSGMCAGFVTGILHTKLGIPSILSGIISQISLYSINIRIMGKANTPILSKNNTVFDYVLNFVDVFAFGTIVAIIIISLLYWFFGTELGSCIRATGDNEDMVKALGVNTNSMKIMGLVLGNGLVALSGSLTAQMQGYADVGMGTGTIVIGLASVILGAVLLSVFSNFYIRLLSVVIGAIIYRIIVALVLQMGLQSTDLNLLTAIVVVLAMTLPKYIKVIFNKTFNRSTK